MATTVRPHTTDADCTLDRFDGCTECGAYHGDPCPQCGGRGYHAASCCPFATWEECAASRERSVAGVSDDVPDCPVHGPYVEA